MHRILRHPFYLAEIILFDNDIEARLALEKLLVDFGESTLVASGGIHGPPVCSASAPGCSVSLLRPLGRDALRSFLRG